MTYSELIKILSQRLGKPQIEVKSLLQTSFDVIKHILDNDLNFTIPKLGTFRTYLRMKRKSFDPFHKQFVQLPAKRLVKYHPGYSIKNKLKFKR